MAIDTEQGTLNVAYDNYNELRFTRDANNIAKAYVTYPLTGEEEQIGTANLSTGEISINGKDHVHSLLSPDEVLTQFISWAEDYVDDEKAYGNRFPDKIEISEKIEGLRFIMWDDGSGRAEYNGNEVGSINLMTGEMTVGDSESIPAAVNDRSGFVEYYKDAIEQYVKKELIKDMDENKSSVIFSLTDQEALVLINSLNDMVSHYRSVLHDEAAAEPYSKLQHALSISKSNIIELTSEQRDYAEYALKKSANGFEYNPSVSERLVNRFHGMAVREDFSYSTERINSEAYTCKITFKEKPIHAFGGSIHHGRIDAKAMVENVEATINYKMAEINNAFFKEQNEHSEDSMPTKENNMSEQRSQLAEMLIDDIVEKTDAIISNEERMFDVKIGDYTVEGLGLSDENNSERYIEYRLYKDGIEAKYDNFDIGTDVRSRAEAFVDSIADEIGLTISENGILVGRAIEGVSLNGDEFLLDNKGDPLVFNSIEQAKDFLINKGGYDEESLEEINFYDADEELKKWDKSKNNDSEGKKKPSKEQKSDIER